jgi:hypothetical protein
MTPEISRSFDDGMGIESVTRNESPKQNKDGSKSLNESAHLLPKCIGSECIVLSNDQAIQGTRCAASTCPACNGLGGTALMDKQCCCVRSVRDKRKSESARIAQDHGHGSLDLEGEEISARRMVNRERSMGWLTRNDIGKRIRNQREIEVGIARDTGHLLFCVWCSGRRNDGGLGCLGAERSMTRGPIRGLVRWMNRQGRAGSVRGSIRRTTCEIIPATGKCAPRRNSRQHQCNSHFCEKTKPGAIWKRSHYDPPRLPTPTTQA